MKSKICLSCLLLILAYTESTGFNSSGNPPLTDSVSANPLTIGSRLELFIDDYLVGQLKGGASNRLHKPIPREIVIEHDAPWEGSGSGYHSIFKDGDLYKMYYKAWNIAIEKGNANENVLYCCYAESKDGIHWQKPNLGLHQHEGSKDNNIVMARSQLGEMTVDAGHPAVFKDENPAVAGDERYKALLATSNPIGLLPFKSPDGIHWTQMTDKPIITDGAFDSQNLAFWDPVNREYRAYWRYFDKGTADKPYVGVRSIRTAVSKDFIHWQDQSDLVYVDSPREELYTNQIKSYDRAPHLFIGFPTRYIERKWGESLNNLPEKEHREIRSKAAMRYGTAISEGLLIASRDGVTFKRWNEAFLPPGIQRPGTWNYGHQYIGWHVVETKSSLPGAPNELSLYAVESYWTDNSSSLRRYTLRLDGFVSINAPMSGGELITKPLIFEGNQLLINFSTSAAGGIKVEIQDENGNPVPGYTENDCPEIFGDTVSGAVYWEGKGTDVASLQGKVIKLRFILKDSDLYSLQFSK